MVGSRGSLLGKPSREQSLPSFPPTPAWSSEGLGAPVSGGKADLRLEDASTEHEWICGKDDLVQDASMNCCRAWVQVAPQAKAVAVRWSPSRSG